MLLLLCLFWRVVVVRCRLYPRLGGFEGQVDDSSEFFALEVTPLVLS